MTIKDALPVSQYSIGPTVDGTPTTASIFSREELKQSAFLPSLLKTINLCYARSHALKPELGMTKADRLNSTEDFLDGLNSGPESFVVIVHHATSFSVIATASCRRYFGPPTDVANPWIRTQEVQSGYEEWELKLMATHPDVQSQGLASFMMALVEREVVRRHHAKSQNHPVNPGYTQPKAVRMVLCTARELYGDFYIRRGYAEDYETHCARNAEENFHITFMSKTLAGDANGPLTS